MPSALSRTLNLLEGSPDPVTLYYQRNPQHVDHSQYQYARLQLILSKERTIAARKAEIRMLLIRHDSDVLVKKLKLLFSDSVPEVSSNATEKAVERTKKTMLPGSRVWVVIRITPGSWPELLPGPEKFPAVFPQAEGAELNYFLTKEYRQKHAMNMKLLQWIHNGLEDEDPLAASTPRRTRGVQLQGIGREMFVQAGGNDEDFNRLMEHKATSDSESIEGVDLSPEELDQVKQLVLMTLGKMTKGERGRKGGCLGADIRDEGCQIHAGRMIGEFQFKVRNHRIDTAVSSEADGKVVKE